MRTFTSQDGEDRRVWQQISGGKVTTTTSYYGGLVWGVAGEAGASDGPDPCPGRPACAILKQHIIAVAAYSIEKVADLMPELVIKPRNAPESPRGRVHTIHYELSYLHQGIVNPAAPVVVLLHDFPGNATSWQPVMPAITKYPVLAFDLLGNGESDKPWPADTSVWGHADAINLALRDMGLQQVILVGYGLGGGVAQVLATRLMPELTRGLVLIDSIAYNYSFNPNWPLTEMEKRQDPELPLHTSVDQLVNDLRQTIPQGSANPASITGATLDALVQPWANDLGKELLFQQIRKLTPSYLNAVGSDIAHITCPTLLIWGERDTIVPPKWGERLRRAIAGSQLHVVAGAGHLILLDAPAAVARLLGDFTAQV